MSILKKLKDKILHLYIDKVINNESELDKVSANETDSVVSESKDEIVIHEDPIVKDVKTEDDLPVKKPGRPKSATPKKLAAKKSSPEKKIPTKKIAPKKQG